MGNLLLLAALPVLSGNVLLSTGEVNEPIKPETVEVTIDGTTFDVDYSDLYYTSIPRDTSNIMEIDGTYVNMDYILDLYSVLYEMDFEKSSLTVHEDGFFSVADNSGYTIIEDVDKEARYYYSQTATSNSGIFHVRRIHALPEYGLGIVTYGEQSASVSIHCYRNHPGDIYRTDRTFSNEKFKMYTGTIPNYRNLRITPNVFEASMWTFDMIPDMTNYSNWITIESLLFADFDISTSKITWDLNTNAYLAE